MPAWGMFRRSRARDTGPADDALTVPLARPGRRLPGPGRGDPRGARARGADAARTTPWTPPDGSSGCGTSPPSASRRDAASGPRLVAEHVDRVLASLDAPDPFDELSEEAGGARRPTPGSTPRTRCPRFDGFPHREFVPGVVELLALDLPETVAVFNHEHARGSAAGRGCASTACATCEPSRSSTSRQLDGPGRRHLPRCSSATPSTPRAAPCCCPISPRRWPGRRTSVTAG